MLTHATALRKYDNVFSLNLVLSPIILPLYIKANNRLLQQLRRLMERIEPGEDPDANVDDVDDDDTNGNDNEQLFAEILGRARRLGSLVERIRHNQDDDESNDGSGDDDDDDDDEVHRPVLAIHDGNNSNHRHNNTTDNHFNILSKKEKLNLRYVSSLYYLLVHGALADCWCGNNNNRNDMEKCSNGRTATTTTTTTTTTIGNINITITIHNNCNDNTDNGNDGSTESRLEKRPRLPYN